MDKARDIGINLAADEVKAALAGTLREVRRRIKVNRNDGAFYLLDGWPHRSRDGESNRIHGVEEPYRGPARVGDCLWVRETWAYFGGDEYLYQRDPGAVTYRATYEPSSVRGLDYVPGGRWRSSQQMPRWASRLTLVVTGVRAELVDERWEWVVDVKGSGLERGVFGGGWVSGPTQPPRTAPDGRG